MENVFRWRSRCTLIPFQGRQLVHTAWREISQRKQSEEALRASEEKYRAVVDCGVIVYFEMDLKGKCTYCNKSFTDLLGYPAEELIGMNFKQFTKKEDVRHVMDAYANVYLGKTKLEIVSAWLIRKDGQFLYGENYVSPKKNDSGEIIGFLCIGIDITDRKKWVDALRASEEKYRISEEKYRSVLNVGAIGYYETDLKGTFTYCNESFLTQILSSEKLIGTNFSAVTTTEQKRTIPSFWRCPLRQDTARRYNHKTPAHPDGAIKYADHYVATMKNA